MALAEVGEDLFVECEHGDYIADLKAARPHGAGGDGRCRPDPTVEVDTPDTPTIETWWRLSSTSTPRSTLKCICSTSAAARSRCWCPGTERSARTSWRSWSSRQRSRLFDDEDFARLGYAKGYVGPQGFGDDVTVFADRIRARRARIG